MDFRSRSRGALREASQAAGAAPTLRYGPAGDSAPRLRLGVLYDRKVPFRPVHTARPPPFSLINQNHRHLWIKPQGDNRLGPQPHVQSCQSTSMTGVLGLFRRRGARGSTGRILELSCFPVTLNRGPTSIIWPWWNWMGFDPLMPRCAGSALSKNNAVLMKLVSAHLGQYCATQRSKACVAQLLSSLEPPTIPSSAHGPASTQRCPAGRLWDGVEKAQSQQLSRQA